MGIAILVLTPLFSAHAVKMVNSTFFGVAINGYDPVAYFTQSKPMKGDSEYSYTWKDAKWRFASKEHLELFKASPEKYAPQYGGYCAWAVSQGYTAKIDPDAWTIHNGKLYLNFSLDVRAQWLEDMEENIRKADKNWPEILSK